MGIAQLSKELGKNLEQELTFIFAVLGDSQLPEAAHVPRAYDGIAIKNPSALPSDDKPVSVTH